MEQFILDNLSTYGPVAVFILLMLSGFGIALGEEMVTVPAGMFVATGRMGFLVTALSAYLAIVAADILWFSLCRHYGTPLLHKRWIKRFIHPRRLLEVKHQFERRGTWLIVMARFIPSSRTTAITVAGLMHMPFWRFALATASCVLITVPLQIGLGVLVGLGMGEQSMPDMMLKVVGLIMLIVASTVTIGWWSRHRMARRRAPRAKASWLRRFRQRRPFTSMASARASRTVPSPAASAPPESTDASDASAPEPPEPPESAVSAASTESAEPGEPAPRTPPVAATPLPPPASSARSVPCARRHPLAPPGVVGAECSMRAVVTGQIGMNKKPYLGGVVDLAGQRGDRIEIFHVGDMMYGEAPDVRGGRILDLPLSRLTSLRRAAFKDIIAQTMPARDYPDVIVNTHATFRWRHGLFSAFDFDQMRMLEPNLFICLVDNIEVVHHRLHAEHDVDATLKDCMVWREEEILATELLAQAMGCPNDFYIVSRGRHTDTIETCQRLVTRNALRKVYPSFPMSHVMDMPEILREIDEFRAALARHFITFDPGDVDEKVLLDRGIAAAKAGQDRLEVTPSTFGGAMEAGAQPFRVSVREILEIAGDIDGQIYMRDFKLIDQSDMIVSLIPELPGGAPGLSSGVERELQHAFEHTKEVYVVWKPEKSPSPFITETATRIFRTVDEALAHFERAGMFAEVNLFGH